MNYITVGKENSCNIDLYYEDQGSGVTGDLNLVFFGRHENASSSVLFLSSLSPAS